MPIQMTVKTKGAELVRKGLEDLTTQIPQIARSRIYNTMLAMRRELRTPAPRPTYPIRWDSDRQRRYVLAMLRARDDLPYQRTGELPAAWEIVPARNGYRLENPKSAALYLYGDHSGSGQSNIHAGRHPLMAVVVENHIMELPPDIENHISYYARGKGLLAG